MSTTQNWKGFTKDVLAWIEARISNGAEGFGLKEVRIGEKWRGWSSPACFIFLAPEGATLFAASGRHGLNQYRIPVRVAVLTRNVDASDDVAVLDILESILQDLAGGALPPGCSKMGVVSPGRIVPLKLAGANGAYDTVGSFEVEYLKGHEAVHLPHGTPSP